MQKRLLAAMAFLALIASVSASTYTNFTVYWSVASSYDHTISFNANCAAGTAYFVENDAIVDGNQWKVLPYSDSSKSATCQSDSAAYFTVTITGSATSDLDLNVSDDQTKDVNFKVYLSNTDIYCGDDNCNGWENTCTGTPVTNTSCYQAGTALGEFYGGLTSGNSAAFCACADFNAGRTAGGALVDVGDWQEQVGVKSRAP